jgi:RecB family endonuclease NucS
MTPAEVRITLRLLQHDVAKTFRAVSSEATNIMGEPMRFSVDQGVARLTDAQSEAHLEASILANPSLLPQKIRPDRATLCRQVPICPFKPADDMDRADICFYYEESIAEGSVPNTIIELKNERAGNGVSEQVVRYATWLRRRLGNQSASVRLCVLAPSFVRNWTIPREFRAQISNHAF